MVRRGKTAQKHTEFHGIYPMLFAFFDGDDRLSRKAMRRQVNAMVASRVHGLAVLGLATECNKLSTSEKRQLLDWVAEDLDGRLPLSVTISETSVRGQTEFVAAAAAAGASWVVLQPPPVKQIEEAALIRFFGAVAERSEVTVGLQIAPGYLDSGLSADSLRQLSRQHPNIAILKVEMAAMDIAALAIATDGAFDIFNGHAGLELPDCLRAGCSGIIPGVECADVLALAYEAAASSAASGANEVDRLYADVAPFVVSTMTSIDRFLIYAKRLAVRRLGLSEELARLRSPTGTASAFGCSIVDRHTATLGPFAAPSTRKTSNHIHNRGGTR
jgi:4-hydroxy-tetrahydrodipicolinate synthase